MFLFNQKINLNSKIMLKKKRILLRKEFNFKVLRKSDD
jgi:hypothetical protein